MNIKTFSRLLIAIVLFALAACGQKASNDNRYHSIRPGEVWLDINGNPIQAHGFQVFYEDEDSMLEDEAEYRNQHAIMCVSA